MFGRYDEYLKGRLRPVKVLADIGGQQNPKILYEWTAITFVLCPILQEKLPDSGPKNTKAQHGNFYPRMLYNKINNVVSR